MLVMNDCFVACLAVNHADDALYSLAEKMVGDRVSHFTFAQLYLPQQGEGDAVLLNTVLIDEHLAVPYDP
jgi:hypothetical protein